MAASAWPGASADAQQPEKKTIRIATARAVNFVALWGITPFAEKYGLQTDIVVAMTNADQQRAIQLGGVLTHEAGASTVNADNAMGDRHQAHSGAWSLFRSRVVSRLGWERLARRALLPLLLLALWQYAASAGWVDPSFIPSPAAVLDAWWQWIFGPRSTFAWYSGTWFEYVWLSAWRVFVGFAIASIAGITVGVLIGWFEKVRDLLDPLVQGLRPIPMTAWLPFATFMFGIREGAAIFLISMGSFFPIVVSCTHGAEQTPKNLVRAALMLGTPPARLLTRVVLPSALPSIFNGLRVGLGIAWVLVIVSEMLAVKGGIGYAMWTAYQFVRIDLIIAAMFTMGLLGLVSDRLLLLLNRRLLRWNTGLRAR